MLKWIVGSKVDHPLADPKQARDLIAELPPYDHVKALEEITHWLETLNETDGFRIDRVFEIADLLDSAARTHQRKLIQEYLGTSRQQKFQENRLWKCGYKFARALGDVYLSCIRKYRSGASGAAAIKKHLPVVIARALRALGAQVKWTMLRYGASEPRLWSSVGELYGYSVENRLAQSELTIYAGLQGTGTIQQEYLKVMMLWASSADVLPPLKQEIAERTVASFANAFNVGPTPFTGALYVFNLKQDKPPARLFGNAPAGDGLSFFGPGEAAPRLQELISTAQNGAVPASLNLGADYPVETVVPVLKHLAIYWSDKPPARASERRATTARITVVPGYFALLDELERGESDALNFSVSNAESWVVENVSDRGYGALVPAATSDWIRVGEIIGLQVEGTEQWGAGIVRRVMRDEQRQYRVGIEVISRRVTMVRISQGQSGQEGEYALLLSGSPDKNGEIGLIMRAGRYDPNLSIDITGRSKSYRFTPVRMIDAGDDFDWGSFKVERTP